MNDFRVKVSQGSETLMIPRGNEGVWVDVVGERSTRPNGRPARSHPFHGTLAHAAQETNPYSQGAASWDEVGQRDLPPPPVVTLASSHQQLHRHNAFLPQDMKGRQVLPICTRPAPPRSPEVPQTHPFPNELLVADDPFEPATDPLGVAVARRVIGEGSSSDACSEEGREMEGKEVGRLSKL